MEVVDHNTEYEQVAVGRQADQRQSRENDYDNMYDKTGWTVKSKKT